MPNRSFNYGYLLITGLILFWCQTKSLDAAVASKNNSSAVKSKEKIKLNYRYLCEGFDDESAEGRAGGQSGKNLGIACNCPSYYAPVCGSDNITYHNRCFMHCRARHSKDGQQKYRLVLKKFGECS